MALQSLKKRFSIKEFAKRVMRMTYRFPIALALLVALTAMLSLMIWYNAVANWKYTITIIVFLVGGIFLDFAATLWGEEQHDKRLYYIVKGAVLGAWTVFCAVLIALKFDWENATNSFGVGILAWFAATLLIMPVVSFLSEKNDVKTYHFTLSLIKSVVVSFIIALVMLGGVLGLLHGTVALFDLPHPNIKISQTISIVCMVLVFGIMYFSLVPSDELKHDTSDEVPKFLKNTVIWLLMPLLGCYMAVLYVYALKILFTWQLPKGLISYLVSAVMCGYLACYALLYPQIKDKASLPAKLLTRWIPAAIIPLLVLMTVGVIRRFADYGITVSRLYLITVLVWFYAVCIFILVQKNIRLHWIVLSFVALMLLSSSLPLNYYFICKKVMTRQIDDFIARKAIATADDVLKLSAEDKDWLRDRFIYMNRNYRDAEWNNYSYITLRDLLYEEQDLQSDVNIVYRPETLVCPKGQFATFSMFYHSEWDEECTDSINPGIFPITTDRITLLIDTAAVSRAAEQNLPLFLPSTDGKGILVPEEIEITDRHTDYVNIMCKGCYFNK